MEKLFIQRITGVLLIGIPLLFMACFTLLQVLFDYPAILRQPASAVFVHFQAGGPRLIAIWYTLTLTALLFIPVAVLLHTALAERQPPWYLGLASVLGVLAGLAQGLGFLRWSFLMPSLAGSYLDPAATAAQRDMAALIFDVFNRYAGMAIGEHLGYMFTGLWTVLIAGALGRTRLIPAWLSWLGAACAGGVLVGLLEPAGWSAAGPINAVSYMAWAIWLVAVGALLLRAGSRGGAG